LFLNGVYFNFFEFYFRFHTGFANYPLGITNEILDDRFDRRIVEVDQISRNTISKFYAVSANQIRHAHLNTYLYSG